MGNRLNVSHGGTPRTKRLSSLTGLEVKQFFSTSGRGRSIFLDIPLYRSGVYAHNSVNERNADFWPMIGARKRWAGTCRRRPSVFESCHPIGDAVLPWLFVLGNVTYFQ